MENLKIDKQRIQISTRIKGLDSHSDKQLKSFVQNFLWNRAVGCDIERIRHTAEENATTTQILFEAEAGLAYAVKKSLIEALNRKFPDLHLPPNDKEHWIVEPSKEILTAAKISHTSDEIRRDDSSGAFSSSKPLAEPDLDALSLTSSVRRALLSIPGINVLSRVLQSTRKLERRVIYLHYRKDTTTLDITIMDWDMVKDAASTELNIALPVRKFWHYVDGFWSRVANIESFQDGHHYYITAETDPDPSSPPVTPQSSAQVSPQLKFNNMSEFYEALRGKGLDDEDISVIQAMFVEQRIKASVLDTLTDEKLKEDGLKQLGLREAILKVLRKE